LKPTVIVIHHRDTVAVALKDIRQAESVRLPDGTTFPALVDIPYSHKVALKDIAPGEHILKYGEIIGEAKTGIRKGDWVHAHNLDIEEQGR
jgi:altronate hydrolase